MTSTKRLSQLLAALWLAVNSNLFVICVLAILSWGLAILVGYGAWILAREIVSILEDVLRVILNIS